ncbi:MAG: peptidase S41 [Bacteroidetes bacterium]|nr:peptidase S41 [Bacteroidota bacterium]HET6245342.1 S41 family peptidase [Bacteroidia bacterium]
MKYIFPLFFIASVSLGQNIYPTENPLFIKTLEKDSIINELGILYDLLNTIHPGQFMHTEKAVFDNCYDSLRKSIQTDLTTIEYYCKTSLLLSKIKDGHTWVENSTIKKQLQNELVFPFSVYKASDKFIISKSGTEEYNSFIGKTILKINDKSISEIVSKVKPYISLEGENETGMNYTFQLFPFYYFFIDSSNTFKLDYLDSIGNNATTVLKGIEYREFTKNTRRIVEPIHQEFKEGKIAILTVNTFYIGDFEYYKINYKKYIDDFFKKVEKLKISSLIIDVRGNSGGSAEVSNYLFSYLTDKPYYYFEYVGKKYKKTAEWKFYSTSPQYINDVDTATTKFINNLHCEVETDKKNYWWFEKQKGKRKYHKGEIITLIDGGCFSTTGHFVSLLKDNQIGKLYGECTQGSYYSNDGGHMFQLPYSKLLVRIPTAQFKMRMPNFQYNPKGICPDLEINKKPDDFKTKYDRQLDSVIEQLSGR